MKKTVLLLTIIIAIFTVTSAQFSITDLHGTPIVDGDVITFNTTEGEDANLVTLITNNSGSDMSLKLIAESIEGTDGSQMEFCIGTCHWGITVGTEYGPLALAAGATSGSGEVHFHNHSTENDVITYDFKIYEEGNETNAIHFTYKYDVNYVGIDNISKSNSSVYPNPAINYFTISVNNSLIGTQLILTNLLGKTIFNQKINSQKQTFSTRNLNSGIYFYSIVNNNKIVETKKIIIK